MNHRNRPTLPHVHGWPALAVVTLIVGTMLAACGQPASSEIPDQQAARSAALAAVDDAFAGASTADSEDAATASVLSVIASQAEPGSAAALGTAAIEPMLVIRRVDMQRDRHLLTFDYDGTSQPATATADVEIAVTGTAQIWRVLPDRSLPRELAGTKPIELQGIVTLNLEHGDEGWHLSSLVSAGFSQGANAASVQDVVFDLDPLLVGHDDNVVHATLSAPSTDDDFLVAARSRRLRSHGVLGDAGAAPDETAADATYSGYVWVGTDARPGAHLAFVTALDYSRTVNLTTTDGSFDDPYTDTVQPVLVNIAAGS